MSYTATYSPEDNKLRLYASSRLDDATYQKVKDSGFRWAPKQELFVAPAWSPAREDLLLELAGEIEPEGTTLAERAEMKAARLDAIAANRAQQASAYHRAANAIAERFAFGQPILVGHHSERKARKDQERVQANMDKAAKAHSSIDYWHWRAAGVERHANRKNSDRTRANRIKTLLADLRDLQRRLNHASKALALWQSVKTQQQVEFVLSRSNDIPYAIGDRYRKGELSWEDLREGRIVAYTRVLESDNLARWISHTLNRLAYEKEMQGPTARYTGALRPTLIQMFVREHGADSPVAKEIDDDLYSVECKAPLPTHIGDGKSLELTGDEWRDLMQACGYEPPADKPAKPPILNFKSPDGKISVVNPHRREEEILPQVAMTKAEYAAIYSESKGTRLSTCGNFRVRIAPNPEHKGPRYMAGWAAIFISDQKPHDVPDSVREMAEAREKADA